MNHTQITNKLNAAVGYPPPKVTRMEEWSTSKIIWTKRAPKEAKEYMKLFDPNNPEGGGHITNWRDIKDLAETEEK